MLVGTGEIPWILSFYESCGFEKSHRIKNFFTDNYEQPMFEEGIQLVDMIYLKTDLQMNEPFIIRQIQKEEYPLLEDFLYHAIFLPPGAEPPLREIIYEPEIFVYIKDFGGKDDCGVVAEQDGQIIGAAWTRIIPAYGHIDNETPELAISVLPDFRGKGIGSKIMQSLFDLLRERGYKQTSLSVQKDNPAVRFYKRLGYEIAGERLDHANHEDFLMMKYL